MKYDLEVRGKEDWMATYVTIYFVKKKKEREKERKEKEKKIWDIEMSF